MFISVSPPNNDVKMAMGTQQYYPWVKYKKSVYTVEEEVPEGTLCYNLFTREVIIVTGMTELPKLVHKWFYVPADVDERSIIYSFWQRYYTMHPKRPKRLSLAVIFTTTECNAHCPYCYERGTSQNRMSKETAERVADLLIDRASVKKGRKTITLKWFGGEPLANTEVIDLISNRLQNADVAYSARIISNGYLFDQVPDDTIKNLWKIKEVQITVDGTRGQYEKVKGFPDGTYDRITDTIERLARLGITVMVRVHVTQSNIDDVKTLIHDLSGRYAPLGDMRRYIRLYVVLLFETFSAPITDQERERIYDDLIEADQLVKQSGISNGYGIPKVKGSHCMADGMSSVVIAPTGDITPCEHYHDDEIVGNVNDGYEIPDKWFERTPEIPECKECFYYPQCVRLKMCNAESPCNEQHRRYMRYRAEKAMEQAYRTGLQRRNSRNNEKGGNAERVESNRNSRGRNWGAGSR